MSQDLHKLTVSIEAQINQFKKACEEVKRQAAGTAKSANESLGGISDKKSANAVQRTVNKVKELRKLMKEFSTSAKFNAGLIAPTKEAAELQALLEATQDHAAALKEQLDSLDASKIGTQQYVELTEKLANAEMEAAALERQIDRLGVSRAFGSTGPPSFVQDLKAYMAEARDVVTSMVSEFGAAVEDMAPPGLARVIDKFQSFRTEVRDSGSAIKRFAVGVKNDLVSAGKGLGNFLSRIPLLGRARRHANGAANGFRYMRRSILSAAVAMLSAVVGFNAVRTGMSNLEQYSARTRNDLNTLRGSLLTVQNALATAFAPVLSVVVPILATLMNYITAAATAVAHFIAALTGSATVVVAKNVGAGVASGMGGAADSTNAANDAAEKYKRTLMGFDQINKLDDPTSSSGSGGSGGGGGAGGVGVGDMFETVEVSNAASEWAKRFKEAWENADFTEIGGIIGQKLKDALDSIDWTKIQEFANKVAKCIATGLNGFLETPGLFDSVGKTLAEALNTVFGFANTFATVFHWDSLGKAVSDTVNAFFRTFKFDLAAQTLSNIGLGILEFFTTAVNGIDWSSVGSSIVTFFANIKWADLIVKALGAVDSIVTAIHGLLKGAIDTAVANLKKWIDSGQIWEDLFKVGTAALNLSLNLIGTAWDLVKSIFGGLAEIGISLFQSGWKSVKEWVGERIGGAVDATIKLVSGFGASVTDWVKTQMGNVKDIAVDVAAKVSNLTGLQSLKKTWDGIKTKTKTIKTKAITTGQSAMSKIKSTWEGIKSGTKSLIAKASTAGASALETIKKKWSGIKSGTKSLTVKMGAVWNGVKDAFLKFIGWKASGGVYAGGHWHPVQSYATGGSPTGGQMFLAREAGPELVGTIGGNTAVMNNDQIVSSVAAGVAKAVAATIGNGNSKEIHIHMEGDAKQLFRVVKVEAENYTNSTGLSPFPV